MNKADVGWLLSQQKTLKLPFALREQNIVATHSGLTNRSFTIAVDRQELILRVHSPYSSQLGIDRNRELSILKALSALDIAPKPRYIDPNNQFLIYQKIKGHPLSEPLSDSQKKALETLITRYQAVKITLPRLSYLRYLQAYRQQIGDIQDIEEAIGQHWQSAVDAATRVDKDGWIPTVCHHDLRPANLIQSEQGIKIIDWEYAALAHPQFDRQSMNLSTQTNPDLDTLITWINALWSVVKGQQKNIKVKIM